MRTYEKIGRRSFNESGRDSPHDLACAWLVMRWNPPDVEEANNYWAEIEHPLFSANRSSVPSAYADVCISSFGPCRHNEKLRELKGILLCEVKVRRESIGDMMRQLRLYQALTPGVALQRDRFSKKPDVMLVTGWALEAWELSLLDGCDWMQLPDDFEERVRSAR